MKKTVLILAAVLIGTTGSKAATKPTNAYTTNTYRDTNPFIFMESGATFSVYPNGEFDFYIDNRVNVGTRVNVGNVGVTFNSGYNYNPFVQYDDYGAVIQVENIPIFYDYYGRVRQIGNVDLWYRNGQIRRVGGLNVYYSRGVFSHCTGFINRYNRQYVYRPFHGYFVRPAVRFRNVYYGPYRRYYRPVRYTFHRPYRHNHRRTYATVGKTYRNDRSVRRANIYRNDRRVTVRDNNSIGNTHGRANRSIERPATRSNVNRTNSIDRKMTTRRAMDNRAHRKGNTVGRSSSTVKKSMGPKSLKRTNRGRGNTVAKTIAKRETTRTSNSRMVIKHQVGTATRNGTVAKNTATGLYKKSRATKSITARSSSATNRTVKRRLGKRRSFQVR